MEFVNDDSVLTNTTNTTFDFPGGSNGKESAYNVGNLGLISGSGKPLEKGMATHSSILAWRIPWTEEPGGLQSMGLQRVEHTTQRISLSLLTFSYLIPHWWRKFVKILTNVKNIIMGTMI